MTFYFTQFDCFLFLLVPSSPMSFVFCRSHTNTFVGSLGFRVIFAPPCLVLPFARVSPYNTAYSINTSSLLLAAGAAAVVYGNRLHAHITFTLTLASRARITKNRGAIVNCLFAHFLKKKNLE